MSSCLEGTKLQSGGVEGSRGVNSSSSSRSSDGSGNGRGNGGSNSSSSSRQERKLGKLPALAGMVLLAAPCVGTVGLIREMIADVGLGMFGRLVWVLVRGGPLTSPGAMRTCWFSAHLDEAALLR